MREETLRQIPWQLESELAAKMERKEQIMTFYSPEVTKIKGDRKYQRVRRQKVRGEEGKGI